MKEVNNSNSLSVDLNDKKDTALLNNTLLCLDEDIRGLYIIKNRYCYFDIERTRYNFLHNKILSIDDSINDDCQTK